MAAIDKTYLYRWEDYEALLNWCKSVGAVTDDYGLTIIPLNWLWEYSKEEFEDSINRQIKECWEHYHKGLYKESLDKGWISKEDYDNWVPLKHIWGIPVWNTSTRLDIFLIRNCPLEFIQDRLKEQYGGGWSKQAFTDHNDINMYEQIKNKISPYDTFKRNGLGKNIRIAKHNFPKPFHIRGGFYYNTTIHVEFPEGQHGWYYGDHDYWPLPDERFLYSGGSSSCANFKGHISPKALFRKFQKWDFPKGTKVTVEYRVRKKKERLDYYEQKTLIIK